MRADRLVSLVLLLRQGGRMSAPQLARELEVSVRTVLRDIDALSTAGVPVYAERGRHGGYALLPGFRTELTGLTHEEALALLAAGAAGRGGPLGLDAPAASALRKVLDALPPGQRETLRRASARLLVDPEHDLLSRRRPRDPIPAEVMQPVQRAVHSGHRLRIDYAASGEETRSRVIDPLGLVTVRERVYLLATRDGLDRTYRVSRVVRAEVLPEPAERPAEVDLDRLWEQRRARFLAENRLEVSLQVRDEHREALRETARAVRAESPAEAGWVRLDLVLDDLEHAVWAVWQAGPDIEVLAPPALREAVRARAEAVAERHRG